MRLKFRKIRKWLAKFFKDLFYGTDNLYADLARIMAFLAVVGELVGLFWNMHKDQAIDLGPMGLGGGLAAILTAAAAIWAAKAWSGKTNRESQIITKEAGIKPPTGE